MGIWTDDGEGAKLRHHVLDGGIVPPFHLLAVADDPALQLANARAWAERRFPRQARTHAPVRKAGGKIRIGYFSADFHNHATMWLMIRMLELHDKGRFEVHAFSDGPEVQDAMRARVLKAADAFHDIRRLSDEAAARLARDSGIDIAVDLKGYTENGRPGIFAARAAPSQVAYLGYPGTTGADFVDYLIADRVVVPEDQRAFYAEQVVYLPNSYQVNDSDRAISAKPLTRAELGLPETGFVFCCLNNNYKITPPRIRHLDAPPVARRGQRSVAARRQCLDRRQPAPRSGSARHRRREARLRRTPPDGGTSGAPALRRPVSRYLQRQRPHHRERRAMGRPAGAHPARLGFAARVAGSLLHAIGLPELATETAAAYEALAFELATNPVRLAEIKARLTANRTSAPLFDTALFTRNIEHAFEGIVAERSAGA